MKFKYMQKSTQDIHNKFLQEIDHELERIKFELEHTQPLSEDDVVTQILRLSKNTYRGGGGGRKATQRRQRRRRQSKSNYGGGGSASTQRRLRFTRGS